MNTLFSFGQEDVAKSVYGEGGSGNDQAFDPVIFQGYDSTCAVRSQQIILRDFGVDISQEQLIALAEENGWYSKDDGTPMGYVGYILQTCGVGVHQDLNCTMYDLVNELAQGHRVIVGVDADELWDDGFMGLKGDWNDLVHGKTPNHALIVAGVEVNPKDPTDVKVILTDPGTGDLRKEYSLDDFMDAWEDSDCFMVATNDAAPYQYDQATGREIPSNFYTEAFIDNNSYPLSPDDLMLPDGYLSTSVDGRHVASGAAYGEGHLNTVPVEGHDVDYEKYKQALHGANTLGVDEFDAGKFKDAFLNILGIDHDDMPTPEPEPVPEPMPGPIPSPDPEPDPIPDPDPDDDDLDDDDDTL